ncbi:MAG: M20/M25/M40 family metallo-hydrolase, partial [Gemmatimonadetes bacterium]|nr:M20/M25/M40 family metallo-hydrolase [Gemmatimonadota bacterium]
FREKLDEIGFQTRWVELPPEMQRAGHLFAERRGPQGKKVLMIGHLDTVFEEDSPFQRFTRTGPRAHGPGAGDMKGGDVVMVFALQALASTGALDGTSITVAITGDEESPGEPLEVTRGDLVEAGKWSDVALGFEGGRRADGIEYATVARRSSTEWRLEVTGRQAHSSLIFSDHVGAGAIFEAARILSDFYNEVRGEEYLTINPGTFLGGTSVTYDADETRGTAFGKTNVVPRTVTITGGIRTISPEQLSRTRDKMRQVVARHLPGTSAEITFTEGYPPMAPNEANYALLGMLNEVSRDLGVSTMEPLDPGLRGAADISFVAPHTDCLSGMGVYSSGAHSPEETVELDSILLAAKRAALMIYRLTR